MLEVNVREEKVWANRSRFARKPGESAPVALDGVMRGALIKPFR
jgi:hypothetical protein